MLALPGAWAYQHHRHRCVGYEVISYFLANRFDLEIRIVYVVVFDRLIDDIIIHHLGETVFVCLIINVIADKDFVPWNLRHNDHFSCEGFTGS